MTTSSILTKGYVLEPQIGQPAVAISAEHPSWPVITGPIPNLAEFSAGNDISGSAFIAKKSGWDICIVPENHRAFLPTLQTVMNEQYALGNATQKTFLVRASRHTAAIGEAHQSHIPDWHDHRTEGITTVYSASDILGTKFRVSADVTVVPKAKSVQEFYDNMNHHQASAAPEGMITRFNQNTVHCTPKPETEDERRRTFYVVIAYDESIPFGRNMRALAEMANPLEPYVHEKRADRKEIINAWQHNAQDYFAHLVIQQAYLRSTAGTFPNPVPPGVQ